MKNIFRDVKLLQESEFIIPEISNELTYSMFEKIKPIMRNQKGKFSYLKPVDPIQYAFTWEPKADKEVKENLILIDTVFILHSCYYGFYKGSMEEVFAFIQYHPEIENIELIEANFDSIHDTGSGVISKVNLFKREKGETKEEEKYVNLKELDKTLTSFNGDFPMYVTDINGKELIINEDDIVIFCGGNKEVSPIKIKFTKSQPIIFEILNKKIENGICLKSFENLSELYKFLLINYKILISTSKMEDKVFCEENHMILINGKKINSKAIILFDSENLYIAKLSEKLFQYYFKIEEEEFLSLCDYVFDEILILENKSIKGVDVDILEKRLILSIFSEFLLIELKGNSFTFDSAISLKNKIKFLL